MADKYVVNGTDLTAVIQHLRTIDGNVGVPAPMQDDYMIPGRTGAIAAPSWVGPKVLTVGGLVVGTATGSLTARDDCLNKLRTLARTVFANGTAFPVQRHSLLPTGISLVVESQGRYLGGLEMAQFDAPNVARVAVDFSLLDGFWHSTTSAAGTVTSTASITVAGDVPTSRIQVTFTGGTAAQRLTNNTTNSWLQYGTASGGTATVVDVIDFAATSGTATVTGDITSYAADGSRPWLTLVPGTNSLTLSGGGTAVIQWFGEYL